MNSRLRNISLSALLVAGGIAIGFALAPLFAPKVVSADRVHNLQLATFSNGVTEVLFHDYDYSSMEPGWDIKTTIPAVRTEDNGRQHPVLVAPLMTFQTSNWQREIYTFSPCDSNILFINRDAKAEAQMSVTSTGYCLQGLNAQSDNFVFLGTKAENGQELVLITERGTVVRGIELPSELKGMTPYLAVSNEDNSKIAFAAGACGLDGDNQQVLVWDLNDDTLEDHWSSFNVPCGALQEIVYNTDTQRFEVYGFTSEKRYLIGQME